jgi:hypothetical protein
MSTEQELDAEIRQEVCDWWEKVEGVTTDKTSDGGIILFGTKAGRIELSPDAVDQEWLRIQPPIAAVHLLQYMLDRFEKHYDVATPEQRIQSFAAIEFEAHMARHRLEQELEEPHP